MSIAQNFPTISPSLNLSFALTKALDPRITYTRASTATYYGTETAKAEENLLLQSQTFDNASWGTIDQPITRTANSSIAPDGTTTADTIAETAATGNFGVQQDFPLLANTTYVFSYFVKDVDIRYVGLTVAGAANNYAYVEFDLTGVSVNRSGAVGTGWSLVSSSITASTQSFYRVVAVITTGTTVTTPRQRIFLSNGSGAIGTNGLPSYTGTNKSAYFWGAQVEQRSAVTAYTVTTTQPITNYIPVLESAASGVARFDHNPTTFESLGFLIEESRSNLLTYSEDFADASWTKGDATITSNTIIAPDGTLTGDKLVENTNNAGHYIVKAITKPSVNPTVTIYAKAAGRNWVLLNPFPTSPNDFVNDAQAYFDLANGAVGTVTRGTASITSVGNGWYRCSLTMSQMTSTASTNLSYAILSATANGTSSYTGNGFDGVYLWGAQLEAGAFATSYIPTVASQVTRAADAASMTGTNFSSWFNNGEGSMYLEHNIPSYGSGINFIGWALNTGTATTNAINFFANYSSTGRVRTLGYNGTTLDIDTYSGTVLTANTFIKTSMAIKANDFALSVNGATVVTDTAAAVPPVNQLAIGSYGGGANPLNGWIKKLAYYPLRLTNAQLQAITG